MLTYLFLQKYTHSSGYFFLDSELVRDAYYCCQNNKHTEQFIDSNIFSETQSGS